jgi:uncharacterized protein
MSAARPAWVFTDGHAGNVKQALALASLLGRTAQAFSVQLQGLDRWFAPTFKSANPARVALSSAQSLRALVADQNEAATADLAIGCGRAGAAALRALRALLPACRTVQILAPGCAPHYFDVVLCPAHDRLRAPNVLHTLGAIHTLERDLPSPSNQSDALLLLIGNPTRNARWTSAELTALLDQAQQWPHAIWLSSSRRSSAAIQQVLATHPLLRDERVRVFPSRPVISPSSGIAQANPYLDWLTQARQIVVTPDSVNMLSEAIATRASVHMPWQHQLRGKLVRLHAGLGARLTPTLLSPAQCVPQAPLADCLAICSALQELLQRSGAGR